MKRFLPVIIAGAVAGGIVGLVAADNSSTTKIITETTGATGASAEAAHAGPVPTVLSTSKGLTVNQIFKMDGPGVVDIDVDATSSSGGSGGSGGFFGFGTGSTQTQAEGSGFVLNTNGDIVTAEHVVTGAQTIKVVFPDGHTASANVVGSDTGEDVAVIHVNVPASELHPLTVGDSSTLQVGDGVVAIGSPFGLPSTVTAGIVSAVGRAIYSPNDFTIANAVQTDAAINPGNSGGPLLNSAGQVIGINDQIDTNATNAAGEGSSSGVGFAVPSNTVARVAHDIIATGKAQNAWVGVELQSTSTGGAGVGGVTGGGPAAQAGVKAGDRITAVDGHTVSTENQFIATIANYSPGDTVTFTIQRGGSTTSIKVKLGTQPATASTGGSGGSGGLVP
jgi:putative serine protease PepD